MLRRPHGRRAAPTCCSFHPDNSADEALVARYLAIVQRRRLAQSSPNRAVMARDDGRPWLAAIDSRCPVCWCCAAAKPMR
ncbi:MAG: hypothetical protein U1F67_22225 [Rubrivivax sp.]